MQKILPNSLAFFLNPALAAGLGTEDRATDLSINSYLTLSQGLPLGLKGAVPESQPEFRCHPVSYQLCASVSSRKIGTDLPPTSQG